jgi:Spy/CpxP family protein refolding chaperone
LIGATCFAAVAQAQEARQTRPEIDLLKQSVSEKLQAVADQLGLTPEQRDKIKELHRSFEAKRQALRDQRRELCEGDFKAISEVLTADQREKVKAFMEDKVEAQEAVEGPFAWAQDVSLRDTLAQKLRSTAEQLGLTSEQRKQIGEQLAGSLEKHREARRGRRELVDTELKAIDEILTPEQREKARRYFEQRLLAAPFVQSVCERLRNASDKLGLSEDQRKQIVDTYKAYEEKYEKLSDDRHDLLQSELKAVGEVLTPEQREKVRNYFQDHLVVVDVQLDPNDPKAKALLKETIADRLGAAAEKLGLTEDQRGKIKATYANFAAAYTAQRESREALRRDELKAMGEILTPEQREKVKNYFADAPESP